jgi:myo-inositol-1(or 4)-monophosphatase
MNPTLIDLERLARQAGEILRASYGRRLQVDHKSLLDLVTDADHRSEAYLLGEIQQHFPGQRIMAEESGELQGSEAQTWYIDPLDGTVNYAHGIPIFAVSIGYAEAGQMRLGVVYDPLREECFSAERGLGAWLNGQPLHVAQAEDLDHSLLVTGFAYDIRHNPETNLDHYEHFALRSQGVRRLGSAALDLCYVAAGRFDGYWELRLKAWDVAAGGLIAEQAGGVVTNLYGKADYLSSPVSVVAGNPTIHALLLEGLQR